MIRNDDTGDPRWLDSFRLLWGTRGTGGMGDSVHLGHNIPDGIALDPEYFENYLSHVGNEPDRAETKQNVRESGQWETVSAEDKLDSRVGEEAEVV